jgi:hypothetical protein
MIPTGAKQGKQAAEKAFRKLRPAMQQAATRNAASYYGWWRSQNPQASWLHPASYLNQRRWEDEAFMPPAPTKAMQDRAAFWAEQINTGKPISRFAVSPSLCDEMVGRQLVTKAQLRERGLG